MHALQAFEPRRLLEPVHRICRTPLAKQHQTQIALRCSIAGVRLNNQYPILGLEPKRRQGEDIIQCDACLPPPTWEA